MVHRLGEMERTREALGQGRCGNCGDQLAPSPVDGWTYCEKCGVSWQLTEDDVTVALGHPIGSARAPKSAKSDAFAAGYRLGLSRGLRGPATHVHLGDAIESDSPALRSHLQAGIDLGGHGVAPDTSIEDVALHQLLHGPLILTC